MPGKRGIISGGFPNKEVTPPVIIDPTTPEGKAKVHAECGVQQAHEVSDGSRRIVQKGGGYFLESGLDQEVGVQDVTDQIITGQAEASPSRQEGITSVTDHLVDGEIANSANDKGAAQSPSLPVAVTSGKLGPTANYNAKGWQATMHKEEFAMEVSESADFWGDYYNMYQKGDVGDIIVLIGELYGAGVNGVASFQTESGVNRLMYDSYVNTDDNRSGFFCLWEITSTPASIKVIDQGFGTSSNYDYTEAFAVLNTFTEYGG